MTIDSGSLLSPSVSSIRQDNAKQRSVVQCWEKSLEDYTECRTEPHDALQHVIRGVMSVITQ